MFPKGHVLRAWSPVDVTDGRWQKLEEVSSWTRKLGYWGCAFESRHGGPPPSSLSLLLGLHETSSSALLCPPCHHVLPPIGTTVVPTGHGLKTLSLVPQLHICGDGWCYRGIWVSVMHSYWLTCDANVFCTWPSLCWEARCCWVMWASLSKTECCLQCHCAWHGDWWHFFSQHGL